MRLTMAGGAIYWDMFWVMERGVRFVFLFWWNVLCWDVVLWDNLWQEVLCRLLLYWELLCWDVYRIWDTVVSNSVVNSNVVLGGENYVWIQGRSGRWIEGLLSGFEISMFWYPLKKLLVYSMMIKLREKDIARDRFVSMMVF